MESLDIALWKVFKVGDVAMLLNVLWGGEIDDDEDADMVKASFNWVERCHGNIRIVFPLPKGESISEEEKERIFQLILESLNGTPRRHVIEGDIMEEYELPETAKNILSYFKKFTNKPKSQYWW